MRQDMEMEDKDSGHLRYYFSWQFHMFKFQAKNKLLLFQMSCQEKVSSGIIYLNAGYHYPTPKSPRTGY